MIGMRNIWKPEEDKIIIDKYETIPLLEIVKLLPGRNYNAVKARQTFLGVCKKYQKDELFFEVPNTVNSSISGIIASDGHLSPKKGNRAGRVCLGINTKDIFLLQEFNRLAKSNYMISSTEKQAIFLDKRSGKTYHYLDKKSRLEISSADKWLEDLYKNWNIHSGKKSHNLEPPKESNNLDNYLAYISGIITGDGSIFVNGPQAENCIRISILGTEKLLIWIKSTVEAFLNDKIKASIHPEHKNKNLYTFNINGINAARIIHKINSMEVLKLARKWEKPEVLEIIEILKNKYPSLFNEPLKNKILSINQLLNQCEVEFTQEDKIFNIPSKNIIIKVVELYNSKEPNGQLNFLKQSVDKRVIQIFENELLDKPKIVFSRLKHYLGLVKRRIFARKCEVRLIDFNTKNKFLDKYHIQGQDYGSGIFLGLFYKNRLVNVMTFSVRDNDYELSRFSGINHFNVCGGASKLLSFFEKNYHPHHVFSFADKRWSVGNLYYQLGFQLTKENEPSYFYFHPPEKKLHHKFGFRHKYLINKLLNYDASKTEWENMSSHGWQRIYDCGLIKFEKSYTNTQVPL